MGGELVRLINYELIENNEFQAVNQFTVIENRRERRSDFVLFVNGPPLAVPRQEAIAIRDDVAFLQTVRALLTKGPGISDRSPDEIDHALRQIVSHAVSSDEVIDIFAAARLKMPDISILSDEFLVLSLGVVLD